MQTRVLGLVDNAHSSAAQLLDDAVVRDSLADHLAEILGLGVGQVNEGRQVGVASKRQLTINRVSNNVGGVKHF